MEWIEWLLSSEFRKFLLDHDLFFPLLFLGRLIGITAIELWRPAREVSYRKVILNDLTVFVVFQFVMFPSAEYIDRYIAIRPQLPDTILAIAVRGSRVVLFRDRRLRPLLDTSPHAYDACLADS